MFRLAFGCSLAILALAGVRPGSHPVADLDANASAHDFSRPFHYADAARNHNACPLHTAAHTDADANANTGHLHGATRRHAG